MTSLYENSETKNKVGKYISKGFNINKRLKYGCSTPPTLSKIYLEKSLKIWKRICNLEYEDVEYMTRKLMEEYSKWGLEKIMNKPEPMSIERKQ